MQKFGEKVIAVGGFVDLEEATTLDMLEATEAESPYVVLSKELYGKMTTRWQKCKSWKWQDAFYNAGREFGRHLRKAEVKAEPGETLSIHTLRKSCIQNWANKLSMIVTKELAGHSNIATTQKFYSQVDAYHRQEAAEATERLLNKTDV